MPFCSSIDTQHSQSNDMNIWTVPRVMVRCEGECVGKYLGTLGPCHRLMTIPPFSCGGVFDYWGVLPPKDDNVLILMLVNIRV